MGGFQEEDKSREELAKINEEVEVRDNKVVKRERHRKGSVAAPLAPTYEGKALHIINREVEADATDTDEEAEQQ